MSEMKIEVDRELLIRWLQQSNHTKVVVTRIYSIGKTKTEEEIEVDGRETYNPTTVTLTIRKREVKPQGDLGDK